MSFRVKIRQNYLNKKFFIYSKSSSKILFKIFFIVEMEKSKKISLDFVEFSFIYNDLVHSILIKILFYFLKKIYVIHQKI